MAMNAHDSDDDGPEIRLTTLENYARLIGAEAVARIQAKADRLRG